MTWKLRLPMKHFRYECVLWMFLLYQTACHGQSVSRDGWSEWSLWDSCSAQCEYGISTRTRQCLRKDASVVQDLRVLQANHTTCSGVSAQIKVCRLKACPPEQKSPHQTACSQYDSRMFSGKQYVWEPFIHANDACKLSCRAKGVHFYANLPDKADDGIPCKLGMAEAVCIKGVCKRVGCDGIVESGAVKDTCGVCRGDGSSCQTISGIFTSTSLKRGLNYIISIPAGSTNINVTELQASRNLLVLQAESGQTIINENTSSPVSGVFEAAGTSFTYGAKSASSPKEIIISPGPTNASVILKLLMRGSNPSIMYTFSVPKAVSETVIQQIRRHSQPIELPPESSDNRNAQFQLPSNRQTGSASFQKLAAQRTTNSGPEMSSTGIPASELPGRLTTKSSLIANRYPNFSIQDKDVSNQGSIDKTTARFRQTHLSQSEHASVASSLDKSSTPVYWNSATRSIIIHAAKTIENITRYEDHLPETATAPYSAFNTEENKDYYKEENTSRSMNSLPVIPTSNMLHSDSKGIKNAASKDEKQGNFELPDAHSINSKNEDEQNTHGLSSANIPISNSSHHSMRSLEGNLQSNTNIPSYPNGITDFPSQRAQESDANTHDYTNVSNSTLLGKPQLVNYNDNFDKDTASNPDAPKRRLRYKIPRYSQSFTFMDTYNKNRSSSSQHKSRARQHARHRHRHHESGSQKFSGHRSYNESSQTAEHIGHSPQSRDNELERNAERNANHRYDYGDVDDGQERKEDTEREQDTSEFWDRGNRHSKHGGSETQHGNGDEQVSREMRLRDRDLLIEERRRRMEEQRMRYNERLREYQEKLRQRQHAIDESRRRNYYAAASEESGNNRNVHQPEKIPSLSSSSSSSSYGGFAASRYNDTSSLVDDRAKPSQSRFTATNKDSRVYNTGHNPDVLRQKQVQQRTREHPRTETSNRRQTALQANRNPDDVYTNRQLSGGYSSGNQHSREPPRGQAAPASVPFVVQPPRLEQPDHYDIDGTKSHGQQNSPRAQSHGARYLPGSRAALQSAEYGHETAHGQSANQISSHNRISSGRQPMEAGLNGVDSQSNQIPVETARNTHSAIYEWRVSGLTECTHSCGGGVQQTVVVCVDTVTQAVVTDDNCRYLPRPDQLAMPCNTRPCSAEWSPGPWSPCSVTCGNGEQSRVVTCQARVSPTLNMTMPSSSCEGQERVANRQSCANNPCSSWKVGAWSNCSASCGDGQKTRDVQCVDLDNNVVSADACLELKPDSEERCNLGECGKGWFFTDWPAECPVDCGTGELTRQVFCADDTGSALPDGRCDINQRPAVSQPCRVSRPCGGLWFTGEWLKCDSKCGSGNRHREVLCIKELPGSVHAVVGEENCEGSDKPEATELCEGPPCTPEWYMTSWSQCSQSCGTGHRSREVKCLDSEQKPQEDCTVSTKPKTRDACNVHSCDDVEEKHSEEDPGCTDKFAQCKVVKRARLCRYDYYKTVCCKSCAAET